MMKSLRKPIKPTPQQGPDKSFDELGDLRFRALLSAADWDRLPVATRRRFSRRLAGTETATYVGRLTAIRFSRLGWAFAQAVRLIGSPLPLSRHIDVPAIVAVTEDAKTSGQYWTRVYGRRHKFPQVINSSKCFSGPTGLEEHIGCGLTMALTVNVEDGALHFRSAGYFLRLFDRRLPLPSWLSSFHLQVSHVDLGGARFRFILSLRHPRFGELLYQAAEYADSSY